MDINKIKTYFGYYPTDEQQNIIKAINRGENVVVQAGAGSSKTTTLKLVRFVNNIPKALYLTFNKALADEGKEEFDKPIYGAIDVKTFHSCVMGHYYSDPSYKMKFSPKAIDTKFIYDKYITNKDDLCKNFAFYVKETMTRFFQSDDFTVMEKHLSSKFIKKFDKDFAILMDATMIAEKRIKDSPIKSEEHEKALEELKNSYANLRDHYNLMLMEIIRITQKVVDDQMDFRKLDCPISFDGILKKFHLDGLKMRGYKQLFIDEAQDLNDVQRAIVKKQEGHMQIVVVGDRYQAIYMWRGARGEVSIGEATQLYLSKSFRIKQETAEIANIILDNAYPDRDFFIEGLSTCETTKTECMIYRTNRGVFERVLSIFSEDEPIPFYVSDPQNKFVTVFRNMIRFFQGHKVLEIDYVSIEDLAEAVEKEWEEDSNLIIPFNLIMQYGLELVDDIVDFVEENNSKRKGLCLVTAHGSKGLEWEEVTLGADFMVHTDEGLRLRSGEEETNILYVAATRAKNKLHLHPAMKRLLLQS